MIITLTGFMGCGKSSVGRKLSELLCCPFMDLDERVEERAGKKIPEIFASEGEAAFRAMEFEALEDIIDEYHASHDSYSCCLILALGGGTVMTPECARMVHEQTFCIYLQASVETLLTHLGGETSGRPMLQAAVQSPMAQDSGLDSMNRSTGQASTNAAEESMKLRGRITELMSLRSSTYESVSHLILDTDGKTLAEVAKFIIDEL